MPEARRHVGGCDFCQELVSRHLEQGGRLAQLSRAPDTPGTSSCPQERQWAELAAGLMRDDKAAELLCHASACDHCGPLLRQSLEDFSEDVTPAEEKFLAGLKSARPESQERMAARLAGIKRLNPILGWLLERPFPSVPVPAWAYAGVAVLVAAFVSIMTLPRPVENLLASAYTAQRNLELRIPQADYGPLRVVKGAAGVSRLDRPPALLQSEALIARKLAENPDDPRWLQARGLAELLDRDFDSAIADLQRCLALQPASTRLMIQLACAHFQRAEAGNSQQDYQAGLEFLNGALKIAPDDSVALFNRAIVYQRMHSNSQAMEDWRRYLRVDPNSKWADEARKRLADVEQSGTSIEALGEARDQAERLARKRAADVKQAGEALAFSAYAPVSPLNPLTGTVTLKKVPARMRLNIRQTSGVPMQSPSVYREAPDQLTLPLGHYILTFDAPGYKRDTIGPIGITEGQNIIIEVKLDR